MMSQMREKVVWKIELMVTVVMINLCFTSAGLHAESRREPVRAEKPDAELLVPCDNLSSIASEMRKNPEQQSTPESQPFAVLSKEESRALEAANQEVSPLAREDLRIWESIEDAMHHESWEEARSLIEKLPNWRRSRSVERILEAIPTPEKAMGFTGSPSNLEEEIARLVEKAALRQRDVNRMAENKARGIPVDAEKKAPDYSVEGRLPHNLGPIAPGSELVRRTPEAILTVGESCTYANLQAAIDAATSGDSIWVQGKTFTGTNATVNINGKTLWIFGGLNSTCTDNDGSRTIMDATGQDDSIFEVFGGAGDLEVDINDFELENAAGSTDTTGGGLDITGDFTVTLTRVEIHDNSSVFGGGIYISNGKVTVKETSRVSANRATQDGGGIYGTGGLIYVEGMVGSNTRGGNIADSDSNDSGNGGGIFADGADVYVGDSTSAGWVRNNSACNGGGIYITDASSSAFLNGSAVQIDGNSAADDGGGIYVADGAVVWANAIGIDHNTAGDDGGEYGFRHGSWFVFRSILRNRELQLCDILGRCFCRFRKGQTRPRGGPDQQQCCRRQGCSHLWNNLRHRCRARQPFVV